MINCARKTWIQLRKGPARQQFRCMMVLCRKPA
jgi:hypothetical protein